MSRFADMRKADLREEFASKPCLHLPSNRKKHTQMVGKESFYCTRCGKTVIK